MKRSLACGLALVFAVPAVASAALPAARAVANATARTPVGTQLFFFPGSNDTVNIFTSTNPNTPYQTINLGLSSGSLALIRGVDSQGTLYVTTFDNNGISTLRKYAPPYNGTPATCPLPNLASGALAYDGTLAALATNGTSELSVIPSNTCSPTFGWQNVLFTAAVIGIDGKHDVYVESSPEDLSLVNNTGLVIYPAGSDQAVDTGIEYPIPRVAGQVVIDGSGNMVVYQNPDRSNQIAPQINLYRPGQSNPYRTVVLPNENAGGVFFDGTKTHIYIGAYDSRYQSAELTYPGFKLVRAIGGKAIPSSAVGGGAVFPPAQ